MKLIDMPILWIYKPMIRMVNKGQYEALYMSDSYDLLSVGKTASTELEALESVLVSAKRIFNN